MKDAQKTYNPNTDYFDVDIFRVNSINGTVSFDYGMDVTETTMAKLYLWSHHLRCDIRNFAHQNLLFNFKLLGYDGQQHIFQKTTAHRHRPGRHMAGRGSTTKDTMDAGMIMFVYIPCTQNYC